MSKFLTLIPAFVLLFVMSACDSPEPEDTMAPDTTEVDVATEEARQHDVMMAERLNGSQEVRIVVRNDGFSPATIELEQDIPARLVFIQESTSRCAEQIQVPAFGVDRTDLPEGEETVVEFTPDRAGEFAFVCGMDMLEGTILVRS